MSPQEIWQSHVEDAPRVTLEHIRQRTEGLAEQNRAKLKRFFSMQLFISAYAIYLIFTRYAGKPLVQFTWVFVIVAGWLWLMRWRRKMLPAPIDARAGLLDSLSYYRDELVRQRDAHRDNWRDVLVVNVIALPLLATAYVVELHRSWPHFAAMAVVAVLAIGLGLMNFARIRRGLQKEIDAVDLLAAR